MDRSFRQKISKEALALDGTLDQMDLIDYIENIFFPKAAEYSFLEHTVQSPG